MVSHYLFVAARVLGPLRLSKSIVVYPDGPEGELCEREATAHFDCEKCKMVIVGSSEGVGPDIVEFIVRGTKASIRIWNWYMLQSTTGSDWQDILGTDRVQAGKDAYTAQLGQLALMLEGKPHTIASFQEALAVQKLVEEMLNSGGKSSL